MLLDKNILTKKNIIRIIVLVMIYVLLGNIKSIQANPMVPGAVVAVNMIIIVIAGILFGRGVGLSVGLLGTFANAIITQSPFEFAAVIPHTIMGFVAGYFKEKTGIFISSLAIIIGHALNISIFITINLLTISLLSTSNFWVGLSYEAVFGIVSINVICYLYTAIFMKKK